MRFRNWFENENDMALANLAPASAEVIRSGLQPQVGANEIPTTQKASQDKILALDSHMERIKQVGDTINRNDPHLGEIKKFCEKVSADWEQLKKGGNQTQPDERDGLGSYHPSINQINFMKDNQPLPTGPAGPGPGTFGVM